MINRLGRMNRQPLGASSSIASTTAEAALASFEYVIATLAPSAARRLAIAAPMPREPPVTTATLPANFCPLLLLIICFVPFFVSCSSFFVGSDWPALFEPSWRHIRCPGRTPHRVPSRLPSLLRNVPCATNRVGIPATPERR